MLITNFASGELSPNLNGRVDIQQYYQGAARIENFEIIPTGGIKRRVGTQRIAELDGNNRIIPFIVNKNYVYILELKAGSIDVWEKNTQGNYVVIQTLVTEYLSLAEVREIQYAQNYDTLVLVHKNYRPVEIKFNVSNQTFSITPMTFNFIPDVEIDDDYDYVMICVSSLPNKVATTDGHGKFTYYKPTTSGSTLVTKEFHAGITKFYALKDGTLYQWESSWQPYGSNPESTNGLFTTDTNYPSCVAFFNNRLFFASTLKEPQKIWASCAPNESGTRYHDFFTYKKYVTISQIVKDADLHVFTGDIYPEDVSGGQTTIKNVSQDLSQGLSAEITNYYISGSYIPVGTKCVSATVNTLVINTDKIVFPTEDVTTTTNETTTTTTVTKPITNAVMTIQFWRSSETVSADDYDKVAASNNITTADCSLFFELASDENDAIMFLSSNRFLAAGTESSIWSIDPGISALSVNAVMQGRYGSDEIQGQAVETATVYFAQGKKGIREFYYDGQSEAFRTNNIALLADHILRESAVVDFDYMTNPYSRLLIVQENGCAAEMLYDKTNGIMAWSRLIMQNGKIKNIAVTRGDDENDLIFLVVKDDERYFLELLDYGNEVYLDSRKVYEDNLSADGYTVGAILYNETKNITCPYDDIPDGFISEGDSVYIGYKYRSYIKSMPVVAGQLSDKKRISSLWVRFLNSYLPVVKCTSLPDEKFTTIQEVPYSGVAKVNYPGVTGRDVSFELEAAETEPVNILSVEAQMGN